MLDIGGYRFEAASNGAISGDLTTPRETSIETRRIRNTASTPSPVGHGKMSSVGKISGKLFSWLWVVLLLAGLFILGYLLVDYLWGGPTQAPKSSACTQVVATVEAHWNCSKDNFFE